MVEQYSGLALLNAERLADGPIADARLPHVIPLVFTAVLYLNHHKALKNAVEKLPSYFCAFAPISR